MSAHLIDRIDVFCHRAPVKTPVATSFGVMRDRPAVFVRLANRDGCFGWGEIFANWPAAGAEHRARLLMEDIADLALGFEARTPSDLFHHLEAKTRVRALQCGEPGPFAQVIAGLDTALNDLFARAARAPLAKFLNPSAPASVPTYASGMAVAAAPALIETARRAGHRAFKVKVGFDFERDVADLAALAALADGLGPGERLMADANQAWSLDEALRFAAAADGFGLHWLEEPLAADRPAAEWTALREASRAPLAAGENIAGSDAFAAAIASGALAVLQPDVAKWGGVTGCAAVARRAQARGLAYCPHFLGGGVGLIASAHLLAAVGGAGMLEVDVNPNPLRDAFSGAAVGPDGAAAIADAPGLGVEAPPEAIAAYRTLALTASSRSRSPRRSTL